MKRRSFLKGLFAAPAAAPAIAKAAVAEAEKMALANNNYLVDWASQSEGGPVLSGKSYWHGELEMLNRQLSEFVKDDFFQKRVTEEVRYLNRLDPDLATARSFSLGARMRAQAERNAIRQIEERKRSLNDRIADCLKQIAGGK